jgi:hypothetical protein
MNVFCRMGEKYILCTMGQYAFIVLLRALGPKTGKGELPQVEFEAKANL